MEAFGGALTSMSSGFSAATSDDVVGRTDGDCPSDHPWLAGVQCWVATMASPRVTRSMRWKNSVLARLVHVAWPRKASVRGSMADITGWSTIVGVSQLCAT